MTRLAATMALLLAAGAAGAAPPQAEACAACHGADGLSVAADIPHLAGQRREYLLRQLQAFRDGTRPNELMAAIARQLAPAEMEALAAHWAALPAGGGGATAAAHPARESKMVLPADFPAGFTEYSRATDAAAGTTAVRYANAVALAAARAGRPLPDGSAVIVATQDAQGQVVSYSGMASRAGWGDAVPALLRNGNWNYGLWNAKRESRLRDLQPRCLACHQPQAASSHVFTLGLMRTP